VTHLVRKFSPLLSLAVWCLVALCAGAGRAGADRARTDSVCVEGECSPAITQTKYFGWDAYRLSDGQTEALVVPVIGRVMSFGRVGGDNWLWSAKLELGKVPDFGGWKNWGGEKTWLSPQNRWGNLGSKNNWPPAKEWDQLPFKAQVLSGGHLKLVGPVSPVSGVRIIREFWHAENGDFVIQQSVEKLRGTPLNFGIWNITQVDNAKIDAVYLPLDPDSDYDNGFRWMNSTPRDRIAPTGVASSTLKVLPTMKGAYKIGVDAPYCAIAVTRKDWAFVERASRARGEYPDGEAGKSGTSVQLYGQGDAKMNYLELELLSPLRKFVAGARWNHTVKWRLEKLPSSDASDPAVHSAIEKLLMEK
jgi:hypothetical protein